MKKNIIKIKNRQDFRIKEKLGRFFFSLVILFSLILSPFLLLVTNNAEAVFNKQINYQGKLTTAANVAVANGTYNMEFKLYDSGSTVLWTETRTGANKVQVTSGLFSVMLGEVNALTSVDFNQTLYLGVNIGGTGTPGWDGEMSPRKKLGAVPSAVVTENSNITNDSATSSAVYPTWVTTNSGGMPLKTSSAQLSFIPSTGALTVTGSVNSPTMDVSSAVAMNLGILTQTALTIGRVGANTTINGAIVNINSNAASALNITSGTTGALTLDSGTTGVINIGTGTSGKTINIGTNNTTADTIIIGSALDTIRLAKFTTDGFLKTNSTNGTLSVDTNTYLTTTSAGTTYVPYTGANANVNLGAYTLTTPKVLGGSTTTSPLTFQTTSGVGTTGADMHFKVGNAGGTEAMTILNNGNVGIGTMYPSVNLHIASSSTTEAMMESAVNDGSASIFNFYKSRGSLGSNTIVQNGDSLGEFDFGGYNGTQYIGAAGIKAIVSGGTPSLTSMPGSLVFSTAPVGTIGALERMRINEAGNVGINTVNPLAQLQINTSSNTNKGLIIKASSGQSANLIELQDSTGGYMAGFDFQGNFGTTSVFYDAASNYFALGGYNLQFANNGLINWSSTTNYGGTKDIGLSRGAAGKLYVGNGAASDYSGTLIAGNVGIGTTSPSYKLDVKGTSSTDGISSDMGFNINQVGDPTAPTGVVSAGGSVDAGTHYYGVSYITATGETHVTYTAATVTTTAVNKTVTLTIPTSTDPRVTGRKIYRAKAALDYTWADYYVGTVANNTATTYVDTAADSTLTIGSGAGFYRPNTTSGNISVNGTKALTIDTNGTYLGKNAGSSNTYGGADTFIGNRAGLNNTTGTYNSFLGDNSGSSNTTGGQNIAIGSDAFAYNQTGNDNVVIGHRAGSYSVGSATSLWGSAIIGSMAGTNLTGSYNTIMGSYAGYNLTSGTGSVVIGNDAGRYIADGSTANITSATSTYIGYSTKALSNGDTNETVIGYNTIGNGSNTVTIGNSSNLRTYLTGLNLKAGTATAGTAPLKLTAGTNLGTTEAGAIEYNGTHLYFTAANGGTRYQLDQQSAGANLTIGTSTITSGTSGRVLYNNAGVVGEMTTTGSGTVLALATTPTFTTNITTPLVLGGSTTTSPLTFQTTSGVGTTGADMHFKVGNAGGTEAMTILNNGNVGVGVAAPSQALDVAGSIEIPTTTSSTTGVIYKGVNRFIHNFALAGTDGNNTFVGTNSGNFTMTGSTTYYGSYNTGIGANTLTANTTGHDNTAIGMSVLTTNTTGFTNTGMGSYALYNNTTGGNNFAFGDHALFSNVDGGSNIGIGNSALRSNVSGYENLAIGNQALYSTTGSGSVALGYFAGRYETGSNSFYLNNKDQTTTANDKVYSLLYGKFSGTAGSLTGQQLTVNGTLNVNGNISQPYDNVAYSIGNNQDVGITKKLGVMGKFTFGSSNSFVVAQSSGSTVDSSNTFTDKLTLDGTGNLSVTGSIRAGNIDNSMIGGLAGDNFAIIKKSGESQPVIAAGLNIPIRFVNWSTATLNGNIASGTLTERMRINGDGNIGIGTTSPAEKLDVLGNIKIGQGGLSTVSAAAASFSQKFYGNFWRSSFGATEEQAGAIYGIPTVTNVSDTPPVGRLTLQAAASGGSMVDVLSALGNGNVGIGSTSPQARLHIVQPDDSQYGLIVERTNVNVSGAGLIQVKGRSASTGVFVREAELKLMNTDSTVGNYTSIVNNNSIDQVNSGIDFVNVDQAYNGAIRFNTRSLAGSYGERMRINGIGNVGIGTTSPNSKLDIKPLAVSGKTLTIETSTGTNALQLGTYTGSESYAGFYAGNITPDLTNFTFIGNGGSETVFNVPNSNGSMAFRRGNNNTSMQIDGAGNVGIGNTGPNYKLDVTGDINATSSVISPYVIGGILTTSDLYFKTTTAAGASGSDMHFLVGNNGAIEAMTILNDGKVGINNAAPSEALDVNGNIETTGSMKFTNGFLFEQVASPASVTVKKGTDAIMVFDEL